jgi:hypothetical protein
LRAIGGENRQSTQEGVDDPAHVQQLHDGGERCFFLVSTTRRRFIGDEICPRGGNQRSRAIRVHEHEVPRATPVLPTQDRERASFERMPPARHRDVLGEPVEVVVMGSMSCVPSTPSNTPTFERSFVDG